MDCNRVAELERQLLECADDVFLKSAAAYVVFDDFPDVRSDDCCFVVVELDISQRWLKTSRKVIAFYNSL